MCNKWAPIETAPKDGTEILVCGKGGMAAHYITVTAWPQNWTGKWPSAYMAAADGEPTHWMPLPPPPESNT